MGFQVIDKPASEETKGTSTASVHHLLLEGYLNNTTGADYDLSKADTSRGGWLCDRRNFSIHRFKIKITVIYR